MKMHAVLFALQCFVEWVLKKIYRIQENYILHFTHADCALFSTAECFICMCSLFMGMPLKPYFWPDNRNWCQLKILSLATCYNQYSRKKQWNLLPSTFFYFSSPSHLLTVTISESRSHSSQTYAIVRSDNQQMQLVISHSCRMLLP
jgi:hypothetical protein